MERGQKAEDICACCLGGRHPLSCNVADVPSKAFSPFGPPGSHHAGFCKGSTGLRTIRGAAGACPYLLCMFEKVWIFHDKLSKDEQLWASAAKAECYFRFSGSSPNAPNLVSETPNPRCPSKPGEPSLHVLTAQLFDAPCSLPCSTASLRNLGVFQSLVRTVPSKLPHRIPLQSLRAQGFREKYQFPAGLKVAK